MDTPVLSEIEKEFARLPTEAQLNLLERLVHQTRVTIAGRSDVWGAGLSAMAADPEIRRELDLINDEFQTTETDRLGKRLMPIQRGEIYLVNLNPVEGREQSGRRPVLVISADAINRLPLVVTVAVGTKGENISRDYPTNVRLSPTETGLPMETVFLCFQVRSLDPGRFSGPPTGKVSSVFLEKVENALRFCLGL